MTEHEWQHCTDPTPVLEFLRGKASDRKLRLFAVACCRRFWGVATQDDRTLVRVAEMFADGEVEGQDLAEARRQVQSGFTQNFYSGGDTVFTAFGDGPAPHVGEAARSLLVSAYRTGPSGYDRASINARYQAREAERARQVATIRCLFGNPFRPASLAPAILTWNDATVVRLAQAAYEERKMPEGTLDNGRLAVLADALEEAGCTDADVLGHLRGQGPHVRGCWAVDLCLGKS